MSVAEIRNEIVNYAFWLGRQTEQLEALDRTIREATEGLKCWKEYKQNWRKENDAPDWLTDDQICHLIGKPKSEIEKFYQANSPYLQKQLELFAQEREIEKVGGVRI